MWGIDQAWSHWVVARKCGHPPFVPRWAGWIPYPGHYYALSRLLILAGLRLHFSCNIMSVIHVEDPVRLPSFPERACRSAFALNYSTKMRKNPTVKLQDCSSCLRPLETPASKLIRIQPAIYTLFDSDNPLQSQNFNSIW